jgi:epoxyqueuosine reductase
MFTTADLSMDAPEIDHCGSCRACLDACPTDAFPAPYQIDARRCISYLTIEHKGPIDPAIRPLIGNRIYGCDDCLAACPWNKFARAASEMKLQARADLKEPAIAELLTLDDPTFRTFFSGSPVKRIGRDRFVRNVLIAAGNSGDAAFVDQCRLLSADPAPVVRAMAVWALSRLLEAGEFARFAAQRPKDESDSDVLNEWRLAGAA